MRDLIFDLHSKLVKKELSSVELTNLYFDAINKQNENINAYVSTFYDDAINLAKIADKMISGGSADILCGIPMAIKDNICSNGQLTTCCSKMLQGFKPYYDATAWANLKSKGAVLLGKTNMDEFAMGNTSQTSVYGAPINPLNSECVTGGSSGGSAAAVCGNLAPYALGSDTGGSVRQPASFCGVVGLKPTYGSVSRYGLIAYASSLDQIGIVANGVKDAAVVFDAICGEDIHDQTTVKNDGKSTVDAINGNVKGLSIGVVKEFFDVVNSEVRSSVENAIKSYEQAGAKVVELSMPSLKKSLPVYYIIACAEASSNLGRYDGLRYGYRTSKYNDINEMMVKSRNEGFGEEVKRRIMLGAYVLSSGYYDAYYKKACLIREQISAEFNDVFEKCDVLITPTTPTTAFSVNKQSINPVDLYAEDICTVPVNIAGLPAVSIPCGRDSFGMPIGMQIIGNKFEESTILNAAYYYQQNYNVTNQYKGGVQL